MKVFELHFNPKAKDIVFDSFVYEPENISERNLGSLYMVGQISNALPQDAELLNQIAQTIKTEYYSNPQRSVETAFKESLKKANEFLNKTAKEGKVSWLGNLNFAALSIKEAGLSPLTLSFNNVPLSLNFAQTGEIKILLLRGREILDISQNLEFQSSEVYPLKIFENIVSGKLVTEDKLMILTKEIFKHLSNKNSIGGFAKVTDEKVLNEILKPLRKELSEISGALLFVGLTKTPQKMATLPQVKIPAMPRPTFISIKWPSFSNLPTATLFKSKVNNNVVKKQVPSLAKTSQIPLGPRLRKKVGLVILLSLVLALTFFAFEEEREKELKLADQILAEVQAQKAQAQNFLIFNDKGQANRLLQSAWLKIAPLAESNSPLSEKTTALKKSIEKELAPLNQMETISNPELVFEIPVLEIGLVPQRMLLLEEDQYLYFSNPYSANLYQLSLGSKEGRVLKASRNLKLGTLFQDSILYFCAPDVLLQYLSKNNQFQEFSLSYDKGAGLELNLTAFNAYYNNNLYFLEAESGEIIKFDLGDRKNQVLIGENWINSGSKKRPENGKSIAIDGNIWVLSNKNQIDRYHQGEYKESFDLDFFPFMENPVKIWTSAYNSYLYLLEPAKNRIVILNKYGEIVRQYQSEKFDNLLDFAVSKDGKTTYLLNGSKVYKITTEIQ